MKNKLVYESVDPYVLDEGKFGKILGGAALGAALVFGSPNATQAQEPVGTEQNSMVSDTQIISKILLRSSSKFNPVITVTFEETNKGPKIFVRYTNEKDNTSGEISLDSKKDMNRFERDLKIVSRQIGSNYKVSRGPFQYGGNSYKDRMIIFDKNDKYTAFDKINANRLLKWLESINFNEETYNIHND